MKKFYVLARKNGEDYEFLRLNAQNKFEWVSSCACGFKLYVSSIAAARHTLSEIITDFNHNFPVLDSETFIMEIEPVITDISPF